MSEKKAAILVVDDEESLREVISRKLQSEGYECVRASSGEEALKALAKRSFDLVLSDIRMPGMSGMDLLTQIRSEHADMAVMMLTAVSSMETAVEAMKIGAYDYVIKPFETDDLVMRVDRALERRRLALENMAYQKSLEQLVEHQVGQIRHYYRQAIEALAQQEIPIEKLDATVHLGMSQQNEQNSQSNQIQGSNKFEDALQTARALALMAEMHETYASGHSERVSLLAREIAAQLNCTVKEIQDIHLAAILHDIGKIVIPDHILFKKGKLSAAELSEIQRHPAATVDIIRHVNYFNELIPIIESHHEWYNGEGYPGKLCGNDIPLGARVIAVADAYDAMACPRPHRPRFTDDEAAQALREGAGEQWDTEVVNALLRALARETITLEPSSNE